MADTMTENDDLDIVEVDTIPASEEAEAPAKDDKVAAPQADADADADEDDDEDDGDERLASSQDDSDEEIAQSARVKRAKRRQLQKQAKERTLTELRELREQNALLERRLAAVEGNTLAHTNMQVDARLEQAQREVRQAEQIIAKATEAGNGDDVVVAMRIRDDAKARVNQLEQVKARIAESQSDGDAPAGDGRPAPQPRAPDPRVANLAQQWMAANPWYDPQGGDEDSAITNAIDKRLTAEGYDPTSIEYWEELTERVSARLNPKPKPQQRHDTRDADEDAPRRKGPKMATGKEHAPASTRKQVYVTPERKQAMIDAGVWDDPVQRQRYLKAYADYDRNTAR